MEKKRKIIPGVYVVIDPWTDESILLHNLSIILKEKIAGVQLWDHFCPDSNNLKLVRKVTKMCHENNIPVLINNHWEWLLKTDLDGVHFDNAPGNYARIKKSINREFISGLTCSNDLSLVKWADDNRMDYISFCSVFPSSTSNSCELVKFETIRLAKEMTSMPVFLSGGIRPENMHKLNNLQYDGVAVVSGIMQSRAPDESVKAYINQLSRI